MLAGQARREQCVCTISHVPLVFSVDCCSMVMVLSLCVFLFKPLLLPSRLSAPPPCAPTFICADFLRLVFFHFFFSYSHDNAKSYRMNVSSPFDGAPSFCSRKFSAVTPFSSPVSARWPTQFGKQMLSM